MAGVNPYKSRMQVFLEKTNQINEEEENEAMYWGLELEPVVAREFQKREGVKVWRRNAVLQHPEYEWMLANIDRRVVGKKEGLECKTSNEFMKDKWDGEEIPDTYYLQCQHYMAVTGYEAWWIAVLIGGNKFRYKKIERDEEIIKYLIQIERDFWNLVKENVPPEIDGSRASSKLLKKLYPEAKEDSKITLPEKTRNIIEKINYHKAKEKEHKKKKKEFENQIKEILGESEVGFLDGEEAVTWKNISTTRFKKKNFKKEYPDLYEKYSYNSSYRRLLVKL